MVHGRAQALIALLKSHEPTTPGNLDTAKQPTRKLRSGRCSSDTQTDVATDMLAALISSVYACYNKRGGENSFPIQSAGKFYCHIPTSHSALLSPHLATRVSLSSK